MDRNIIYKRLRRKVPCLKFLAIQTSRILWTTTKNPSIRKSFPMISTLQEFKEKELIDH